MNILENFGLYVVQALGFLAKLLGDATAPLPWPLVMAVAALPLLFVANVTIWFLRGMVWPVSCKYPETQQRVNGDAACRVKVAGEWSYCRHHSQQRATANGKGIDPHLPRWQTNRDGQRVDRDDIPGISSNVSLLFYRGFVRSPRQVWKALPSVWSELRKNVTVTVNRLTRRPVATEPVPVATTTAATATGPTAFEQEKYIAFDARAQRADQALYVLKWLLPAAFVMVAAAAFVQGPFALPLGYAASLLLWIAFEVVRQGLFKASGDARWRTQVFVGTLKGFGIVVAAAVISMALSDYVMPFFARLAG